jgi:tetratricopeptide (TPR) repeat protein
LERLEAEHDNVRTALHWAKERHAVELLVQLSSALWQFWKLHGHFREGRTWLERAVEAGGTTPDALRAPVLLAAGEAAAAQGDHTRAVGLIDRSIYLFQQIGDTQRLAAAMSSLGMLLRDSADYPRAEVVLEVCLELQRSLGDRPGMALTTDFLGCIARNQGDYARAEQFLQQSLALYQDLDDAHGIALAYHDLGEAAHLQGDDARAAELYATSLARFQVLGAKVMIAWSLHNQGYLKQRAGEAAQAIAQFQESLQIFRDLGVRDGIAACLLGIAGVTSDSVRATRLLGASEAVRESIGGVFVPLYVAAYDRTVSEIEALAFKPARAEGRAMPLEQAIAYGLEDETTVG